MGLPKTVDNDVFPIRQSLGAWTAAEEGAKYFENLVNEHSSNPRMVIIHEVMVATAAGSPLRRRRPTASGSSA